MFNIPKFWAKNKEQYDKESYDLHQDIWIRSMKQLKKERFLREYDMMYLRNNILQKTKKKVAVCITVTSGDNNIFVSESKKRLSNTKFHAEISSIDFDERSSSTSTDDLGFTGTGGAVKPSQYFLE